jgi:hypothetical protein
MKKLTMFFFLTVIFSCSTNEIQPLNSEAIALKSERNYFKNWEDFNSRYFELAKSSNEQTSDDQSSTYLDDDASRNLSPALNKILNKNREFQIADEIIWYNNGSFYSIKEKDEKRIQDLKLDYLNLPICKNIVISMVEASNQEKNITKNSITPLGISGAVDARYQYEFYRQSYYDCGSTINQGYSPKKLKYVHELATELITSNMQRNYYLYLRIKLEYNLSGNKWRPATLEKRTINVNITDDSRLVPNTGFVFPHVTNNIVSTFSCSYDQKILLRYGADSVLFAPNTRWDASVTGTIIHSVNGDYFGNEWTNYVNW